MTVKILEVSKITPSPGSSDICLPLSFFDLIWLRSQPVEYLFFYESQSQPGSFFTSILPELKHSLSKCLSHFLPVAGNLIWPSSSPNPVILYKQGDGVLFTTASCDADFFHFSSNNLRETNIFQPLIASINVSDSQAPLIAIKATLFPNQAFCLGITLHHAIFDMKSFTMFMKTWTLLCRLGENKNIFPQVIPMFDRKSMRECYQGLEKLYLDVLLKQDKANPKSLSIRNFESPSNILRGTFQLSGLDVKRLKKFVSEIDCALNISTFTITYAYLIVCLVKAKEPTKNVRFSIVVDCRTRLEPPTSAIYFGNCLGFFVGEVDYEKLIRDDGIIVALYALNRTIKSLDDGVLKGAKKWILPLTFEEGKGTAVYLVGSTSLKAYDVDFGWGRPRKVEISSIQKTGSVSLIEGRDGDGGVEIGLCLSKDEMTKFASAFAQGLIEIKPVKAAL